MRSIREALPKGPVYQVKWPHYGGRFIAFGYVDKPEPGLAKQLGISILGSDPLWNKFVFINEGKAGLDIETALVNLAQESHFGGSNVTRISGSFVISSDPTRDKEGRSGKVVFITGGKLGAFKKEINDGRVLLKSRKGSVLISHEREFENQKVNVIVPDDIDIKDPDQIGWAIATRCNPDTDIELEKERITFLATRKVPPVAELPNGIKKKIERRIRLLSGRFH
jgi:UbiD family decarboxylases